MPYVLVTNLARALDELVEAGITVVGLADEADSSLYSPKNESTLTGPLALVMGAEGDGMRRLTRERCDTLVSIPMGGAVGGIFFYLMGFLWFPKGNQKLIAIIFSTMLYFVAIWISSVLAFNFTGHWN